MRFIFAMFLGLMPACSLVAVEQPNTVLIMADDLIDASDFLPTIADLVGATMELDAFGDPIK